MTDYNEVLDELAVRWRGQFAEFDPDWFAKNEGFVDLIVAEIRNASASPLEMRMAFGLFDFVIRNGRTKGFTTLKLAHRGDFSQKSFRAHRDGRPLRDCGTNFFALDQQVKIPATQIWVDIFVTAHGEGDYPPVVLAIECDGREFHDRSAVQVARDKKRDRKLSLVHLPVLHFAGREINNNVDKCAGEVFLWLSRRRDRIAKGRF